MRQLWKTASLWARASRLLAAAFCMSQWLRRPGSASVAIQRSLRPGLWAHRKIDIEGQELGERSITLEQGPGLKPSMLHILERALSTEEVASMLEMFSKERLSTTEALHNPVRSPCVVLAEDGCWRPGPLSRQVRVVVEERLLVFMRMALACNSLEVAQVILRYYPKDGCRSHEVHTDHTAFGTAVADLTPESDSGLFVCSQSHGEHGGDGAGAGTFFVPFDPGDVAVHGWEVWHGIQLKQGHDRVSLIVWVRPSSDVSRGSCSWYWAPELQEDTRAAYHMGIEAWRQRQLGRTKAALLQVTLDERDARHLRSRLRALGGKRQAELWYIRCMAAASRKRLGEGKFTRRLREQAEAEAAGSVLQRLRGLKARPTQKVKAAKAMRGAFRRGWEDAQRGLPDLRDVGSTVTKSPASTPAEIDFVSRSRDRTHAARLLQQSGLVVFTEPIDALKFDLLQKALGDFQEQFAALERQLDQKGISMQMPFEFNEVCSRLPERYDVRLPIEDSRDAYHLEEMPWMQLIRDVLGIASKELSEQLLVAFRTFRTVKKGILE